jgi:hypothetical protein
MKSVFPYLLAAMVISFTACENDDDKDNTNNPTNNSLVVPTHYDSTNYSINVSGQTNIRTNIDAMVTEVKKGRVVGGNVSASTLNTQFTSGVPSITSITSAFYSPLLVGNNGWFQKAEDASGNIYHPDSSSTIGGAFGGYLFDEKGFEPEQMIEKGLFGAALANEAMKLITSNPTLENVDKALYLIGATPHFKSSSNTTLHGASADKYLAVYVARRDKNDGNGFYSQMKYNFIKLQAAIKGGSQYNADRDASIATLKLLFEQANFATVINYCHTSIANLSLTTLTDAQKAATLHAIAECHGFAYGWKTLNDKRISDTQIDEILALLNATGNAKPSDFITDRINQIAKLQTVITKIQGIYGFSNTQIEDFKKNWITEQNR